MIRFVIYLMPVIASLYDALECPYFDSVSNQNKKLNNVCSTSDWLKWECNSCNNGKHTQTAVRHKLMCCPDNINITACRHACNTTEANDTEYGSCTSYCPPTSITTVSSTQNTTTFLSKSSVNLNSSKSTAGILPSTNYSTSPLFGKQTTHRTTNYGALLNNSKSSLPNLPSTKHWTAPILGLTNTPKVLTSSNEYSTPTYKSNTSVKSISSKSSISYSTSIKQRTSLSFGTTVTTKPTHLSNISSTRTLSTTQNLSSTKQSTVPSLGTKTPTLVTLTSTRNIPTDGSISTGILKISKSTTPKSSSTKRRTVNILKATTTLVTASSTDRTQSKLSLIFNISKITAPQVGFINTKTSITLQSRRSTPTYRSNTTGKVSSLKSTTLYISNSTPSTRTGTTFRTIFITTSRLDESSTTPQLVSMTGTKSTTGIRFSTKSTNFLGCQTSRPSFKSTITDTSSTANKHSRSHIPDSSFPLSTVAKSRSDPTVSPVIRTSRPITTNTTMSNNGHRTPMMSPTIPYTGTQTPLRFNPTGRNTLDKYRGGLDCLNGTLNYTGCNNGTKTNNKEAESAEDSDDNGLSPTAVGAIAGCVSAVGLAGTVLAVVMVVKRVKRRVEPFGQDPEVDQSLEES